MITDIQEVENVLTDPIVHCLDRSRFDEGNFGYEGMLRFFNTHQCNRYCRELKLIEPHTQASLPCNFTFFEDQGGIEPPKNPYMKVYKICDLCQDDFLITCKDYYTAKSRQRPTWCDLCFVMHKQSKFSSKCVDCNATFGQSTHWLKMHRMDANERCYECRVKHRDILRKHRELEFKYHHSQ